MPLRLYGTTTSPFVRRVRIVAAELGVPYELIDTSSAEGQDRLRSVSPIWKVPVVEWKDGVIFDSRTIVEELLREHGWGSLRRPTERTRIQEHNLMNAVDAALEGSIRRFYVRRDGTEPDTLPYLQKEGARAKAIMTWVESRVRGAWCTEEAGLGLSEINLYTALGWMRFRNAYPIDAHPALVELERAHAGRESFAATAPR